MDGIVLSLFGSGKTYRQRNKKKYGGGWRTLYEDYYFSILGFSPFVFGYKWRMVGGNGFYFFLNMN